MTRIREPAYRFAFVCVVLTSSILASTVVAPTPGFAQSRKDIEAAKKQFRQGKEFYQNEEFEKAAAAFTRAYELSGRSELLYNIGQSHRFAGDPKKAEEYLQQYLSETPDPDNADDVVELIVELQQQIAAELATVQIDTSVPGREVYVDEEAEARCLTPCSVMVPPGPRSIVIKGEGAVDAVEEFSLEPGKTLQLKLTLDEAVRTGKLMLNTDRPGGVVVVADVEQGLPLQQPIELEVGEYPVTVESARGATWRGQVSIEPDETTELFVPMQSLVEARKRGSLRKSLAYGFWGVAVASAAGGVLMGIQARDTFEALELQQANGGVDAKLQEQGKDEMILTNVMFGVAGGAVVTGIVLFVWDEFAAEKDPEPRPRPSDELAGRAD